MTQPPTRRHVLTAAAATAILPSLPAIARASTPPKRLTAHTRIIEVNGRAATKFQLTDAAGNTGITLAPGERFKIDLINNAGTSTIIHWHGQLPPWVQDGFPWLETPPIKTGATQPYDYAAIPGTFWMHSHQGLQEQNLMTAPLIVHSAADLGADHQEVVMMLHDFSFHSPETLMARLTGQSLPTIHAMSREIENIPTRDIPTPRAQQASMPAMSMKNMSMNDMDMSGMSMGKSDLNDVHYDAFLTNDRTLANPEIIRTERHARIRLRIINGSSSSQFWVDFGGLTGTVIAADGHETLPIQARRIPIGIAQRFDVLLDVPPGRATPILATLEGSTHRTGLILAPPGASITRITTTASHAAPAVDLSLERRLRARNPLAARKPDLRYRIDLAGHMKPYAWSLNGEFWPHITPLMLTTGQRIEIDLVNHSMMAHPMHLHGHKFQVTAINNQPLAGAVRDTIVVPPMGTIRIALNADNPGRWAFHCHNLYHMMTGMMTEFRYRDIAA